MTPIPSHGRQILFGLLNGLAGVFIVCVFVPTFFMRGIPDPAWICLDGVALLACAWLLEEHRHRVGLGYHWLGLPVQWLTLSLLRTPLMHFWGANDWTILLMLVAWPPLIIGFQWLFLVLLRLYKRFGRKNP